MRSTIKLHIHDPKPLKKEPVFRSNHSKFLFALAKAGKNGLTDSELGLGLGLSQDNARNRRRELVILGLVGETSMKRKTHTGFYGIVWCITKTGMKKVRDLQKKEGVE